MAHSTRELERREKVERPSGSADVSIAERLGAAAGVRYHLDQIIPESQGSNR